MGTLVLLVATVIGWQTGAIRTHHARLAGALDEGIRRSVTMAALVSRLNESDVIIYVESGRCAAPDVWSCIAVMSVAGKSRYLRITVDTNHARLLLIRQIAHELQHALEIAKSPEVVDTNELRSLYRRIGTQTTAGEAYETAEALRVAASVTAELSAHP